MEDNTPLWALSAAAAVAALTGAGYGLVKFVYWWREQHLAFLAKKATQDRENQNADERSSVDEAWAAVDRMSAELADHAQKLRDREKGERSAMQHSARCEAELRAARAVLRIIVAWGKQKGMKLPPDLEEEINRNGSSGSHTPLQQEDHVDDGT